MSYRKLDLHPLNSLLYRAFARTAVGALGAAAPLAVLANPSGGQVVGGSATIGSAGANGVVVTQGSQKAIINWQQFSVGNGQYVQFVQPNSSAVVLNRVTGSNPSSIFGDIIANGQVFLVNPNGVYFAPGASIDVQGLVASTLDLDDADFMRGRYVFSKAPGAPDAGVVNGGSIRAGTGGYVVLAGDYASNSGAIVTHTGRVYLAAGNAATLTLDSDGLISYVVDGKTLSRLAGVSNTGEIAANGGLVVMTADVADTLTATAVNNSGLITAHSVTEHGGEIVLSAQGGDIENSGTLDASATVAGVAGGSVIIRGNGHTQLDPTSSIDARGDGATGGFIEMSGHTLSVRGNANPGKGGTLLIDPTTLTIVTGSGSGTGTAGPATVGVGYIQGKLNAGVNLVLVASQSISAPAITNLIATGVGNLTLKTGTLTATGGSLGAGIRCASAGVCQPGAGTILFTPTNGFINLVGTNINIKGAFTANAQAGTVTVANVTAAGGISLTGFQVNAGTLSASAGNVAITGVKTASGATGINVTGNIKGRNVTVIENLGAAASYGGNITLGSVHATAGSVSIAAVTTAAQGMNITVGKVAATKAVVINQEGHSGAIHFGSISAAGPVSSLGNAAVFLRTVNTGTGVGGTISGAGITAHHGGVQIQATAAAGSGANVRVTAISAPYISVNTTAKNGASITVGSLDATGTGAASVSKDISLFAHATGPGFSPSFHGAARGNVTVNGNVVGAGKFTVDAFGGSDSGAIVRVNGNINVAGSAHLLAVNDGTRGAFINLQSVTARFVDIEARATNAAAVGSDARITITGNVTATGTAPSASPNLGVTMEAGSSGARNGLPQITVTGNITASHGGVTLDNWGKTSGRFIDVGQSLSGVWTGGAIKANQVAIQFHGSGNGSVHVGAVTAAGSVTLNDAGQTDTFTLGPVTAGGAFTYKSKTTLSMSGMTVQAGKGVTLQAPTLNLGNAVITAGGAFAASAQGANGLLTAGNGGITANGISLKSGGMISVSGETLNAKTGTFAANAKGSLGLTGVTLTAANATAQASASLDLTGAKVTVGGTLALQATKDIILSGVTINVGTLTADAGSTIHNGGVTGTLTANALALTAGKAINLSSTQISVGSRSAASLTSDPLLLQALAAGGLSPASPKPNAYFNAGGTLTLGKITLNGIMGGYLYLQAANINLLGPISTPANSVIQLAPTTGTASIGVEQTPGTGSVLNLSNSLLLSLFPGTTLVVGNGTESGAVTLGNNGPFNIGSSNLIVYTSGTVTGLENVTSTGLVTTVQSLLASALAPPTPSEIDPNSSNNNNTAGKHNPEDYDPDAGSAAGGTISQSTDTGGACH